MNHQQAPSPLVAGRVRRFAAARWPVVVAVVLAAGCSTDQPAPSPGTVTPTFTTSPDVVDRGVASESGAVAVAVALAQASQRWLYLDDAALVDEVSAVAAPGFEDVVVDDVVTAVQALRAVLAEATGPVWWVVAPLAWRVDAYRADQARVSVWSVHVLAAAGVAVPQSDWVTTTFDLAWTGQRWRLRSSRDVPGPTPQLGGVDAASTSSRFDDALTGFTRLGARS